jgi:hypothetical protein
MDNHGTTRHRETLDAEAPLRTGVRFRTADHKAELDTGDYVLRVFRGKNHKKYRAVAFDTRTAGDWNMRGFLETTERGADRDRMKQIIDGSEADAWTLLGDLLGFGISR